MLFFTLLGLILLVTIYILRKESLARKRLRDIEEIKQRLKFFDPEHRPGSTNAAADVKFILRCCRYWKLNLTEFCIGDSKIKDEDDLVRKALDASTRAEGYLKTPGFREDARKKLAAYVLKHV